MPPNILLIVFDTARADALEPYGAPLGSTPAIAHLAARGAAVPLAYSTSNWTLPSHASMFSGLLPRPLGLGVPGPPRAALSAHRERMLASVLAAAGYETAGVSANPWISKRNGFDAGFERFIEVGGRRRHRSPEGLRGRLRWALDAVWAKVDDGLCDVDDVVRGWIAQRSARPRPFFWFVNLMECHSPYLPPRPYNDFGPLGRLRAGDDARRFQSPVGFVRASLGQLRVPSAAVARMRHLYARAVRAMDDWLARILEELDRQRLLDETLVVVTSDHGENFGEGGLMGHGLSLDNRLIKVPLVFAGPGSPGHDGRVMSLAALPRMLAEAASLGRHPWDPSDLPDGTAVAQDDGLNGLPPESLKRLTRVWKLSPVFVDRMLAPSSAATDGRFKIVRIDSDTRLYDVETDPLEERDVAAAYPEAVARLRDVIERTGVVASTSGQVAAKADEIDDDADLQARMRMLGYL